VPRIAAQESAAILVIREARPADESFLWDMAWEAVAVSPEMRALGREVAFSIPHVRRYLTGWGRPGDRAVVATGDYGRLLGAAWYRLFPASAPGYGFVAPDIPELSIGVAAAARGKGVGSALLDALLSVARAEDRRAVSLSVDRENPALRLYERNGFRDAGISDPTDSSVTLIIHL
jgi:ribosomal protein S18 acetylase RimI-like enzyme